MFVGLVGLVACSNVLGYDDLSFDDSAGADAGASGGSSGSGGGALGGSAGLAGATATGGSAGSGSGGAPGSGGATSGGGPGSGGATSGGGPGGGGAASGGAPAGGATGSGGGVSTGGLSATGGQGGGTSVAAICSRWKSDRQNLAEGTWTGSVSSCVAGDVTGDGRANALKLVNLYRWLCGLPAVGTDANKDSSAQACALIMDANNKLSHSPPSTWACHSASGAAAAGKSNIASTAGVKAVDLYIADPGNETTMGHRRWILNNKLGPIGLGSTSSYSCMHVIGGSGYGNNVWTAFPPPGPVPAGLFTASYASVDSTGWTIQSESINLASAKVTITEGGQNKPVTVATLQSGYGSKYAIVIRPQGWTSTAGKTYKVSVTGISQPINYDVQVVSCN